MPGTCKIKDLAWKKFSLDPAYRQEDLQKKFLEQEPLLDKVTHFDIELQNPIQRFPHQKRSFAGNSVSYALSHAIHAAILARRSALKLPTPHIRFTHPKTKFFTLGFACPKGKFTITKY